MPCRANAAHKNATKSGTITLGFSTTRTVSIPAGIGNTRVEVQAAVSDAIAPSMNGKRRIAALEHAEVLRVGTVPFLARHLGAPHFRGAQYAGTVAMRGGAGR